MSARKPASKPKAKQTGAASGGAAKKADAKLRERVEKKRARLTELQAELAALEASLGAAPAPPPPESPFAPKRFPNLPAIEGLTLGAVAANVRYSGRLDVMMARIDAGAALAGVFTRSRTAAAPVIWSKERLIELEAERMTDPAAILVNAGNANAFTGEAGLRGVAATAEKAAKALKTSAKNIFVASTGVIGEPLPVDRITKKISALSARLTPTRWEEAARAIMTTDTYPKGASTELEIDGETVRIAGIAKGAGMIAPDMGTMLAFIFTDATVAPNLLQRLTGSLVEGSFNAITIDGDTSTSDMLLVAATGKSAAPAVAGPRSVGYAAFRDALGAVMRELALQIVRDGEGLTKCVEITVSGARSSRAAKTIARAIGNSPLVKTAWAGQDPNWGRIVMAVGKAGEDADRDAMSIWYGEHLIADRGLRAEGYDEATVAEYMRQPELSLRVDVGVGYGSATIWACDLTKDYVAINADYRS